MRRIQYACDIKKYKHNKFLKNTIFSCNNSITTDYKNRMKYLLEFVLSLSILIQKFSHNFFAQNEFNQEKSFLSVCSQIAFITFVVVIIFRTLAYFGKFTFFFSLTIRYDTAKKCKCPITWKPHRKVCAFKYLYTDTIFFCMPIACVENFSF